MMLLQEGGELEMEEEPEPAPYAKTLTLDRPSGWWWVQLFVTIFSSANVLERLQSVQHIHMPEECLCTICIIFRRACKFRASSHSLFFLDWVQQCTLSCFDADLYYTDCWQFDWCEGWRSSDKVLLGISCCKIAIMKGLYFFSKVAWPFAVPGMQRHDQLADLLIDVNGGAKAARASQNRRNWLALAGVDIPVKYLEAVWRCCCLWQHGWCRSTSEGMAAGQDCSIAAGCLARHSMATKHFWWVSGCEQKVYICELLSMVVSSCQSCLIKILPRSR